MQNLKMVKCVSEIVLIYCEILRSLEQFIQTVKGQTIFETECFLTSWRFLRSNILERS